MIDQLERITDQVLELIEAGTPTPIILVDGRTGSGKTTFAAALQNRLFQKGESAPRVIHMDDLYEGWDGLQAGVDYLIRQILSPLPLNPNQIHGVAPDKFLQHKGSTSQSRHWRSPAIM